VTTGNETDFSVTSTRDGDAHVVAVTGQADLHTAPELRAAIATPSTAAPAVWSST